MCSLSQREFERKEQIEQENNIKNVKNLLFSVLANVFVKFYERKEPCHFAYKDVMTSITTVRL